jgi:hypothetical protein
VRELGVNSPMATINQVISVGEGIYIAYLTILPYHIQYFKVMELYHLETVRQVQDNRNSTGLGKRKDLTSMNCPNSIRSLGPVPMVTDDTSKQK